MFRASNAEEFLTFSLEINLNAVRMLATRLKVVCAIDRCIVGSGELVIVLELGFVSGLLFLGRS